MFYASEKENPGCCNSGNGLFSVSTDAMGGDPSITLIRTRTMQFVGHARMSRPERVTENLSNINPMDRSLEVCGERLPCQHRSTLERRIMKKYLVLVLAIFALSAASGCAWAGNVPDVTENTRVHIVGGGIGGLSAAAFAIRDAKVPGKNIHVYEVKKINGGALDGIGNPKKYVCRGARKYNYEAYNCSWDLYSTIPSLENPGKSVMDDINAFNTKYPKNVQARLVDKDKNPDYVTTYGLGFRNQMAMLRLLLTPEWMIDNRRTIDDWFHPSYFQTNFWNVYASMFGFETWHSLIECKRYFHRFLHALPQMVKGTAEVSTTYNQYDSQIRPLVTWLRDQGVNFHMGCKVTDFDFTPDKKKMTVERIHYTCDGEDRTVQLDDGDIVVATIGSMVADSRAGSMTEPAELVRGKLDGSWTLWENIIGSVKAARKTAGAENPKEPEELGNPEVFAGNIDKTKWIVFSVTSSDRTFLDLYENFSGNTDGQADLLTFKDSPWLMSIHMMKNPHFPGQPDDVLYWMGYGLIQDKDGDYVKKPMAECTGAEIITEVCGQLGFTGDLPHILETSVCIPTMNPYDTAHFMPRKKSDRPLVVPKGSTNMALIGQFVEMPKECVFLVESSIRGAQTGIYTLLNVDRKVPKIYKKPFVTFSAIRELAK